MLALSTWTLAELLFFWCSSRTDLRYTTILLVLRYLVLALSFWTLVELQFFWGSSRTDLQYTTILLVLRYLLFDVVLNSDRLFFGCWRCKRLKSLQVVQTVMSTSCDCGVVYSFLQPHLHSENHIRGFHLSRLSFWTKCALALILCNNPKANGKIPLGFCHDATFRARR